mgnify:CR=1 FL=1
MPRQILKDPHLEARIYGARTVAAILIVTVLLGVVLARYYALQIEGYETILYTCGTQGGYALATGNPAGNRSPSPDVTSWSPMRWAVAYA